MDVVAFTRQLVDIESITGNEGPVGDFLHANCSGEAFRRRRFRSKARAAMCSRYSPSSRGPRSFSPPTWIRSRHSSLRPKMLRGFTDAAPATPRESSRSRWKPRNGCARKAFTSDCFFVVGEERDSLGAKVANQNPPGCKFLVNGEPTENRVAVASKGALRVEVIAEGRMAHSAYPELGESAIDKLLVALHRLRAMKLPAEEGIGPCTLNIGVIEGGRAPNVIPDKARAQLLYRLVGPSEQLKREIVAAVGDLAQS